MLQYHRLSFYTGNFEKTTLRHGENDSELTNDMHAAIMAELGENPLSQQLAFSQPPPAKKQRTMTPTAFVDNIKPNTMDQQKNSQTEAPRQKSTRETDGYLSTRSKSISDSRVETDSLAWSRDYCRNFPLLKKRARTYLCLQMSSSPSE